MYVEIINRTISQHEDNGIGHFEVFAKLNNNWLSVADFWYQMNQFDNPSFPSMEVAQELANLFAENLKKHWNL